MIPARARRKSPPEDAIAIRVVVALAVEIGLLAVLAQGVVQDRATMAALVLAPVGYWWSYRRRGANNIVLKAGLAIGLLLVTARFLGQMGSVVTPDAARAPLAVLFIWVQVLHAFDVPRRRDLAFSMVSSTTLIAVGGALALTGVYLGFLLAWGSLAGAWLWLSSGPAPGSLTPATVVRTADGRRARSAPVRAAVLVVITAVALAIVTFSAMPRLPGTLVRAMPFRSPTALTSAPQGDHIQSPGLAPPTDGGIVDFSANGYPGFSDAMDLRARGQLSDDIVFRVRAPFAQLWRAEVFDTFDGTVWTRSGSPLLSLEAVDDGGYQLPEGLRPPAWGGRSLVQTFFIEQPQPNTLFAAGEPRTVYFPSGGLRIDRDRSIRSPIYLDAGMVYSVESVVPDATPEELRQLRQPADLERDRYLRRYLQLPAELPARDRALASRITAGAQTEYDAVMAVQTWLQTNTRYDLTVPREPDGVDAVDHFLFETRRGFCEHIASAMALLLRADGIPTRLVTGYGPGERNPFTGYYEVRNADAHAWLEVYYPGAGWIAYDPTFGVPGEPDAWGSPVGADLLAWAGRTLEHAVPVGVRAAAAGAIHRIAVIAGAGTQWWVLLIGALLVGVAAGVLVRRRRRRRRRPGAPDEIGEAYEALISALGKAGHPPDPSRTPGEIRAAVAVDPALAGDAAHFSMLVLATFERARFAPPGARPDDAEVARARSAAARVGALTSRR